EDLRGFATEADGRAVGAVGKVESRESIIGRGQPNPGGRISGRFLDRVAEIAFRNAIVAAIEVFQAELQRLIRRKILDVARFLYDRGRRREFRSRQPSGKGRSPIGLAAGDADGEQAKPQKCARSRYVHWNALP